MPRFDGSRPGPGRPKGSLSRWSRASLDAVLEVFENLGGVAAMSEWARAHPTDFYRGIYTRLLPTRIDVEATIEPVRPVEELTDAELNEILVEIRDQRAAWLQADAERQESQESQRRLTADRTGATGESIGADSQLEVVGTVSRAEDD